MNDRTVIALSEPATNKSRSCTEKFLLCQLRVGEKDKLGYVVNDILWVGRNYKIYRSERGIYVHFSDIFQEEEIQRSRFTEICPELCELRYLICQMRSWKLPFGLRDESISLYDHNIAQAMMLVLENRVEVGKKIAQAALAMAVERLTNDHTISYAWCALIFWCLCLVLGVAALALWNSDGYEELRLLLVAGMFGATGAVLSIATRLQAFRLRPCKQSKMNYLMSVIRVGIGIIAGFTLFLLAPTALSDTMTKFIPHWGPPPGWQAAAALGLLAGFAERLVPNMMKWTTAQIEPSVGTPAQAVRNEEMHGGTSRRARRANGRAKIRSAPEVRSGAA
jgi:hypothetical protein